MIKKQYEAFNNERQVDNGDGVEKDDKKAAEHGG